jgi:hypothetical protein
VWWWSWCFRGPKKSCILHTTTSLVLASTLVTKPLFHKPPKPLETKRKENQYFFLKTIVDMERSKDPLHSNYDFRDPERFGMNTRHKIRHDRFIEIPSQFTLIFHVICSPIPLQCMNKKTTFWSYTIHTLPWLMFLPFIVMGAGDEIKVFHQFIAHFWFGKFHNVRFILSSPYNFWSKELFQPPRVYSGMLRTPSSIVSHPWTFRGTKT